MSENISREYIPGDFTPFILTDPLPSSRGSKQERKGCLPALKKRCEELNLQPRGTRGESGGQTGITYDISNKHRLGYSEIELIQCMIDGVNMIYEEDLELQKKHNF